VIFYHLWKYGLLSRLDREKILFFFGFTPSPLMLSHRHPLVRSIGWTRALCSPRYAARLADWLRYRVELYDGLQG